ncbi:ABC transporter ATP-binding protein [Trujillonella humicola]|uniref:ABC transporter ATP-binding protein n=1 Tax=Trujillonella humicola TaxID=3383699 RepID=UPI0039068050
MADRGDPGAGLVVDGLVKAYGPVPVLDGASLAVPQGSLTAVLGPSGCGKTTLLRLIAGFERPDSGTITVGGRTVAGPEVHLPPERRRVGVVPQEGALFPHLSLGENVAFGLSRAERRTGRVAEALRLVGLEGLGERMPHELSGGQQQRVAVARALAPRPALVLLDEPFSALDAGLRADLRADVRAALAADGATAVLVTHDQQEALSSADLVAVLRHGRVVQAAAPATLYREPVDLGVATFVGESIVLPGTAVPGGVRTVLGELPVAEDVTCAGAAVRALLRPEQVELGEPGASGGVPATVGSVVFAGADSLVRIAVSGPGGVEHFTVRERSRDRASGSAVSVRVAGPARVYLTA